MRSARLVVRNSWSTCVVYAVWCPAYVRFRTQVLGEEVRLYPPSEGNTRFLTFRHIFSPPKMLNGLSVSMIGALEPREPPKDPLPPVTSPMFE